MAGKKGDRTRPGGLPGEFFFSSGVMRKRYRSKDEEGQEGGGVMTMLVPSGSNRLGTLNKDRQP